MMGCMWLRSPGETAQGMKLPRHLCRPLGPTLDLVEHGPPWTVREEMPAPPPKCDVQRHCRNHGPKCCSACPWCLLQVTAAQHSFRSPGGTWDAGVKWGKAGPQLEGGQRGPWAQQGPAGREGAHELPDRRQSTSTSTSTSTTTTTQSRESGGSASHVNQGHVNHVLCSSYFTSGPCLTPVSVRPAHLASGIIQL